MSPKNRIHGAKPGLAKTKVKSRVLIVEDNTPLRELMADVLALEGCTVTEAFDAPSMRSWMRIKGQEAYPDEPFDLIITDIQMPGETGLSSLERLRRKGCAIPAVVVTAFPELATEKQVSKLDATLLPKPFSLDDLRYVAGAALRPSSRAQCSQ